MVPVRRTCWIFLLLVGCATYTQETGEIRSLYRNGNYVQALARLEESSLKESNTNRLLYQLEKAMILDRMGKLKESRESFFAASKTVDDLYTTSISKTAASFVVNDSVTDYDGEDFEKVGIHIMLALSYLGDNNLGDARVEARKINSRLDEINQKYDKNSKNRYADDAFARYLSAMIYESRGEWDSAIIDYRSALKVYQNAYKQTFATQVPEGLVRGLYEMLRRRKRTDEMKELANEFAAIKLDAQKDGLGEIAIIHEVGNIAVKDSKDFYLGAGSQAVRFSFPYIPYYFRSYGKTGAEVDGAFSKAELTENLDAIASVTLDDRRGRIIVKEGARLLAKGQIVEQARQNFGPIAAIATNVLTAATETADTRSWASLPAQIYVTRISVKPGKHSLRILTNDRTMDAQSIEVQERALILVRAPVGIR